MATDETYNQPDEFFFDTSARFDENSPHGTPGHRCPAEDLMASLRRAQRYGLAFPISLNDPEARALLRRLGVPVPQAAGREEEPSPPAHSCENLGPVIADISRSIDQHPDNAIRDPEACTWGRLAKLAEETGEVVSSFIGVTGQNPRKGNTHTISAVAEELLDVALTALAAWEHLNGNNGTCMEEFVDFTLARKDRLDAERPPIPSRSTRRRG